MPSIIPCPLRASANFGQIREFSEVNLSHIALGVSLALVTFAAPTRSHPPEGADAPDRWEARFQPLPNPVGVGEPIWLTTAQPLAPGTVAHRLVVSSGTPIQVQLLAPHHFLIMPETYWPSKSRVIVRWRGSQAEEVVTTGPDREVVVDLTTQTLTAMENGEAVRVLPVSTGSPQGWATPPGTFWIYRRVRDDHMIGGDPKGPDHWDVEHVPYAQYFNQAIAIHGAWWNHRFGRPISHGCVQLPTDRGPQGPTGDPPDARWLWDFTEIGTPVKVIGQTPPLSSPESTPLAYPGAPRSHRGFTAF